MHGSLSPQRNRRGLGLHVELRGLPAGNGGTQGSTSPGAAQWKHASVLKALGVSDGSSPGSQQPHPALLLSLLSGASPASHSPSSGASPSALAFRSGMPPASNLPSSSAAPIYGRSMQQQQQQQQFSTDPIALARGLRHQTPPAQPSSRTAGPSTVFTTSRVPPGGPSGAVAATGGASSMPRPYAYNPLLPRQDSASAGRQRPSPTDPLSLDPSYSPHAHTHTRAGPPTAAYLPQQLQQGAGAAAGPLPPGSFAGRRRSSTNGDVPLPTSLSSPGLHSQQQQQQQAAGPTGGSPLPGAAAGPGAGGPKGIGYVPLAMRGARTRFELSSGGNGGVGGNGGAAEGGNGDRRMSYEADVRQVVALLTANGSSGGGAAAAAAAVGTGGGRAPAAAGAAAAAGAGVRAGGRWQRPAPVGQPGLGQHAGQQALGAQQQPHPNPHQQLHLDSYPHHPLVTGEAAGPGAARAPSPSPAGVTSGSGTTSTEDSALDYFGVYEEYSASGEDEAGGDGAEEEDEVGEEEEAGSSGGEGGEEAGGAGAGRRQRPASGQRSQSGTRTASARRVRSTANVHAVRKADAAAAAGAAAGQVVAKSGQGGAVPSPPPTTPSALVLAAMAAAAAGVGAGGQPPWAAGLRPTSATAGRPPVPPGGSVPQHGPSQTDPQQRRSSSSNGAALAGGGSSGPAGAGGACSCASAPSFGSQGSGSSEAGSGSRPATASSAWSGYELLAPQDLQVQGRGASRGGGSSNPLAAAAARAAAAADANRRRAASNPRDAGTLDSRRRAAATAAATAGGKAAAAAAGASTGGSRSRCSSAASSRRGGGGGGGDRGPAQTLALMTTLALIPPSSPGGASATSSGSARRRGGLPTSRHRKAGGAVPHRPLHPAVLALATELAGGSADGSPRRPTDEIPTDAKGRAYPYVLPPAFPGTCPTIAFVGPAAERHAAGLQPLLSPTLYVKYGGVANTPVRAAFREAGLRPTRKGKRWIVQWGGILDAAGLAKLHSFQRVNHFPGTWELGHKGHLYRNVYAARRRARGPAAEAFDVVPRFYIMPRDYEEFRSDCERYPDRLYIQKPTNSSRGRGIRMVTRPEAIPRDAKDLLVQHYIANPLLLNGFKFDMRVYAAATCLDPLRLYVFPDGLARLATEPYSADRADLTKRCVHLTNYSVNKKSEKFVKQTDQQQGPAAGGAAAAAAGGTGGGSGAAAGGGHSYSSRPTDPLCECEGSKWSLSGLRAHLEAKGMGPGWSVLWRQVCDIVAAAVIAAEPRMNTEFKMKVPHRNNCFEVWGFDIMLTDTFRAWLIEANTCPSLAADSGLDMRVKCSMVSELLHLLGPVPYDVEVYEKAAEAKRQARLTGLPVSVSSGPSGAGGGKAGGGDDDIGTLAAQQSYGGVQPKSLHELESIDFTALTPAELPDVVLEAEAEMARRGSWLRIFPNEEDPARYLNLFETPRLNNMLLCKYYAQMGAAGVSSGGPNNGAAARGDTVGVEGSGKRQGSFTKQGQGQGQPGGWGPGLLGPAAGGGKRPASREWRPGGAGS